MFGGGESDKHAGVIVECGEQVADALLDRVGSPDDLAKLLPSDPLVDGQCRRVVGSDCGSLCAIG